MRTNALDEMMSLDGTVVEVLDDGTFRRYEGKVQTPKVILSTDDDGQILKEHDAAMVQHIESQGWYVEMGWTRQYSYSGPLMHTSEFVGGSLMEHILETPGLWCALPVDIESEECPNSGGDDCKLSAPCAMCETGTGHDRESVPVGWIVVHRELTD